jgi:hypothetical protein
VIQRAIEDVAQTVQRMRAFDMPRGLERTLSPVDLNQILAQVIDLTRVRWHNMPQERGVVVRVETDFTHELPKVLGAESEGARRAHQSHAERGGRAARRRPDHAAHARRSRATKK